MPSWIIHSTEGERKKAVILAISTDYTANYPSLIQVLPGLCNAINSCAIRVVTGRVKTYNNFICILDFSLTNMLVLLISALLKLTGVSCNVSAGTTQHRRYSIKLIKDTVMENQF